MGTDSGQSRRRRWGVRGLVGLRSIVPAVSVWAAFALGLEAVRRQAIAEFPDGAGGGLTADLRGRLPAMAGIGGRGDSDIRKLERLAALRAQGALTDEEFEAPKRPFVG